MKSLLKKLSTIRTFIFLNGFRLLKSEEKHRWKGVERKYTTQPESETVNKTIQSFFKMKTEVLRSRRRPKKRLNRKMSALFAAVAAADSI